MLGFRVSIGFLPLILIVSEMKPCYECLKGIWVHVDEIWRKMLGFRVSVGLLLFIFIVSEMKPCYEGLKEIGVDGNEIWRKMLGFLVSIGKEIGDDVNEV